MRNLWRIALFVILPILFIGPLVGYAEATAKDSSAPFQSLRQCYKTPENLMRCGTAEIKILLHNKTGKELMELFNKELPEYMCHQFGHIVGREVYERNGSLEAAMEECIYGCGGPCFHGAVEAAFLEQLEIDPGSADIHITEDVVLKNAKEFCKTATMCHGVGHFLFQLYNNFEKPLAICKDVALNETAREDCYWGVFMDHAMQFSTYNILLGENKKQSYDLSNLLFPCDQVEKEYRHACYRYHPRLQDKIFDETGVEDPDERRSKQRSACETLDINDRQSCFEGLGRTFLDTGTSDPDVVRAWSENLELSTDKTAFTRGMIRSMVAHGYTANAFSYCTALPERFARWGCYYDTLLTLVYVALQ